MGRKLLHKQMDQLLQTHAVQSNLAQTTDPILNLSGDPKVARLLYVKWDFLLENDAQNIQNTSI